jgi:hypothetical protein
MAEGRMGEKAMRILPRQNLITGIKDGGRQNCRTGNKYGDRQTFIKGSNNGGRQTL